MRVMWVTVVISLIRPHLTKVAFSVQSHGHGIVSEALQDLQGSIQSSPRQQFLLHVCCRYRLLCPVLFRGHNGGCLWTKSTNADALHLFNSIVHVPANGQAGQPPTAGTA